MRLVLSVGAPRRQATRRRGGRIRAAVYAWLEEISFRTGVTALVSVAAVIAGGALAAVDLTAYGRRSAVPPAAAIGQAQRAVPQTASATPSSGPETALPRPRPARRPARHAASPVAAGIPAAPQT